jgi:hypothetical protein
VTAVDPTRLSHDLALALEAFDRPAQVTRLLLDLLAFYADRTRRPAASSDSRDAPWAMEVAPAALRLMAPALRARAAADPAAAFPAAEALWATGLREPQSLAAAIVGGLTSLHVLEWVEIHAGACRDDVILADLAGSALAGVRQAEAAALLTRQTAWLAARSHRLNHLAWMTLLNTVTDSLSPEVPGLLQLLEGAPIPRAPKLRRAYEGVLAALARRHPAEAAHFVIVAIQRPAAGVRRVAQAILPAFPQPQRGQVEQALSA